MRTGNVCAIKIVELAGRELYNNLDTTFYHENLNGRWRIYNRTERYIYMIRWYVHNKLVQQTSALWNQKFSSFFFFNAGIVHA